MKLLIVVDMQKDFIDGALGTAEAKDILPYVAERIRSFDGAVLFTRDTHEDTYLSTQEGQRLPVPHCLRGTDGWQIADELRMLRASAPVLDKVTFGAHDLPRAMREAVGGETIEHITFVGVCTDICVISNVMIAKAHFPEVPIAVDARGCAGVTPESHRVALDAMRMCQVDILE